MGAAGDDGLRRARASRWPSSKTARSSWRRVMASGNWESPRRWMRRRASALPPTPRRSPRRRSACWWTRAKIRWDAPVIDYLPWFQMSDPYVTREMTVRDLLVHRSGLGLGAGDLLWWPASTYDRREIARRLRYLPLSTSFRSAYAYDNVLYLVAGEVIEAVSGQSWEDFVASRILAKVRHVDEQRAALRRAPGAAMSRRRTPGSTGAFARSRPSTATIPILPAASTRMPKTWRSGSSSSSRKGGCPTAPR